MLEVKINEEMLTSIIDAAVNKAVAKEREKQQEVLLMDADQICAKFDISKPTLQKWRDRREIPFIQIDGVIRYDFNKIIQLKETKRKR